VREFLPEGTAAVEFAYPGELATYVREAWPQVVDETLRWKHDDGVTDPLPDAPLLRKLISTAYQASLLSDEGRSVTFRLMLRAPDRLPPDAGPPQGLHRLQFVQPRPYTPHELRQLASAAVFERSIIGVEPDPDDGFRIWGVLNSGPRWMQEQYGGRRPTCPLPASPVLRVTDPGTMQFNAGSMAIARLEGGRVLGKPIDVYTSQWLAELLSQNIPEVMQLHEVERQRAVAEGKRWGCVDPFIIRMVTQQMVKRLVATIRNADHGGLLLAISPEDVDRIEQEQRTSDVPLIRMKYLFKPGEPRWRFRKLLLRLMATLAEAHPECDGRDGNCAGWKEYQASIVHELGTFDEGILEVAHLAAGLAATDGALVMTRRFDIVGFGGEISPDLPLAPAVAQALDVEGGQTVLVATDLVGTRHRAAYRLVNRLRDSLAIVISQDGEVRFVTWHNNQVIFWRQ